MQFVKTLIRKGRHSFSFVRIELVLRASDGYKLDEPIAEMVSDTLDAMGVRCGPVRFGPHYVRASIELPPTMELATVVNKAKSAASKRGGMAGMWARDYLAVTYDVPDEVIDEYLDGSLVREISRRRAPR